VRHYVDLADGTEIALPGDYATGWESLYIAIDIGGDKAAFDLERHLATPLGTRGEVI
jgi:hypothetical protein